MRRARLILPLLAVLPGCIEAAPETADEPPTDSLSGEMPDVAPARYLTQFMFAGVDGTAFFGSFGQVTDERSLVRMYDAWRADDQGWTSLLTIRDTLPVPRAAWRILPGPGFDVRVGDAREVMGLGFAAPDGRVELLPGDEVAVWTGPTGQRESVGVAGLVVSGDAVGGLLFFRRAARALQFPSSAPGSRGFLLADSVGNGLLIEIEDDSGSAIAHTWLYGSVDAWNDVVFTPDSTGSAGPARRWRFEIPGAELSGTIRAIASPADQPVPAFRVECDLIADGDVFRFTGLAARLELP
ncbi:MAG: hypothetical protein ACC682_11895 [Gemmatimonadota bacterium]